MNEYREALIRSVGESFCHHEDHRDLDWTEELWVSPYDEAEHAVDALLHQKNLTPLIHALMEQHGAGPILNAMWLAPDPLQHLGSEE